MDASNIFTSYSEVRALEAQLNEYGSSAARQARAKKYLDCDTLVLGSFPEVPMTRPIKWESNPLLNRTWQWHLNWMSIIADLISFDISYNDTRSLEECMYWIDSWKNSYSENQKDHEFEFVWHDHATALRAEQIIIFLYYVATRRKEWYESNFDRLIGYFELVVLHAEKLELETFYSKHTNHGLEQSRVLLLISTFLDKHEDSEKWKLVSLLRINDELDFSFTVEGVHVENSPAYHFFVFKIFLNLLSQYPTNILGDLESKFRELAKNALIFLTHIIQPNGLLPIIGDTEEIKVSDVFGQYFAGTIEYEHFRFVHSGGKKGIKPTNSCMVFPKSGYFIYRNGWAVNGSIKDDFQLIFKVSSLSNYHRQQDEGHLLISYHGENWLVDSGMYNHNKTDVVRKYMRSRRAHNVIQIPDLPTIIPALGGETISIHEINEERVVVEAPMNLYESTKVKRKLVIDRKALSIDIFDSVRTELPAKEVQAIFHFGDGLNIMHVENGYNASSDIGTSMLISVSSDEEVKSVVLGGIKANKVYSLISRIKNIYVENQSLRFSTVLKNGKVDINTSLIFKS